MESELILSIETAVHGGSLSLMANRVEIGGWQGTLKISRAEDVLQQFSNLLHDHNIEKRLVKIIVVAKGAGSLTGEKIGAALGKGLAKSIDCRLVEIDIFESLLAVTENLTDGDYLTAVSNGKNRVQWQTFRIANGNVRRTDKVKVTDLGEFLKAVENPHFDKVVLASSLGELYGEVLFENTSRIKINPNSLAKTNALYIASDNEVTVL